MQLCIAEDLYLHVAQIFPVKVSSNPSLPKKNPQMMDRNNLKALFLAKRVEIRERYIMKRATFILQLLFISATTFFTTIHAKAQIINLNEMPRYYDRTARIKKPSQWQSMRDVFHSDEFLLGRNIFSGNISTNMGRVVIDDGKQKHNEFRNALGIFTRLNIIEEFSINTTFYKNFNPRANTVWNSDFTYSIGRYNWRPNTWSYGYENYVNNRYSDNWETLKEKALQGYFFISYGQNLGYKYLPKIRIDSTTNVRFNYFVRYAPKYRDELDNIHSGMGKPSFGVSAMYTIALNLYVESAIYVYPTVRQPWDPDFSYGFGYFDYRPFRLSVTYGNWVINRFPWNKQPYPHYGFLDGNFRVIFNYSW